MFLSDPRHIITSRIRADQAGNDSYFSWPRGRHSAKPEAFYLLVEQLSPGPYLEMFARTRPSDGVRECRACNREKTARHRARKRTALVA